MSRTDIDVAAPAARTGAAHNRDRTVGVGVAAAIVTKGIGLAAPLVITPACFRYLGDQRYGLWMAVTALTGMAWFADLGLGNGLLTRLSTLGGNHQQQRREISSAYATLGIASVLLLSGLVLLNSAVPWDRVFGVTDPKIAAEASSVVLICFGSFLANIPLSLIQRVQYANGQILQSSVWQSCGSGLSMVAVLGAVALNLSPLTVIGVAVISVPLSNLFNTAVYFGLQNRAIRPARGEVRRDIARGLLGLGVRFFVLSAISSVALNLDTPLIAHLLGPTTAAHYAVVNKAFAILGLFVGLVGMAVWPINGEALSRGEVDWVRKNTRRMVVIYSLVVLAAGLALVFYGHQLVSLWVDEIDESLIPSAVLAGLATWSLLVAAISPLSMVQNSIGMLRPQFVGWASFLLLATPLKVLALRHFGLAGLPLAACAAYLVTMWPAVVYGYRASLKACRGRSPEKADRGVWTT